jgi:hypothetical protein
MYYSTIPIHWNIKSAPASPGRSRVRPALYIFNLLGVQYEELEESLPVLLIVYKTFHNERFFSED